jgi:hypothetical protein
MCATPLLGCARLTGTALTSAGAQVWKSAWGYEKCREAVKARRVRGS